MENQSLDLARLWAVLRRWWWLLVACMVVAAVSSYLGTTQMPRIYEATSTVLVGQALEQVSPTSQDFYISQQLAETYREMIKRKPILTAAAQTLGLSYVPLAEDVSASTVEGTQLLEISVRDTDPERARLLADEIANQLILQSPSADPDQDERRAFIRSQLADLEAKIAETRADIDETQAKLEQANSARVIQEYQSNIQALQTKLAGYQNTYASLLPSVEGGTNKITMFEAATTPTSPISPNVLETVATAAAIGAGGCILDRVPGRHGAHRRRGEPPHEPAHDGHHRAHGRRWPPGRAADHGAGPAVADLRGLPRPAYQRALCRG